MAGRTAVVMSIALLVAAGAFAQEPSPKPAPAAGQRPAPQAKPAPREQAAAWAQAAEQAARAQSAEQAAKAQSAEQAARAPSAEQSAKAQSAEQAAKAQSAEQAAKAQAVAQRAAAGQAVNIKLDLTITDEVTPGQPSKRPVTLIVADGHRGSIRSAGNESPTRLFVDASPVILANGNIRVQLGLEYNPRQEPTEKLPGGLATIPQQAPIGGSSLNQQITLILQPDRPLVISQASDPVSDRKITVEVRATILK